MVKTSRTPNRPTPTKQMKKKLMSPAVPVKTIRIAAPLFVPSTRDGMLARRLRDEEERLGRMVGWSYKIVERGGDHLEGVVDQIKHL